MVTTSSYSFQHLGERFFCGALLLILTACSSPPPAPPRQPVVVETSVSTRYYSVRGTTTPAIFAAIDANGLAETSGQRALGLTSADWKLGSGDVDVRAVPCVFSSLTATLHLVVMLPRPDGIEPPTPGFSVLAVNPRIVRHFNRAVLHRTARPCRSSPCRSR